MERANSTHLELSGSAVDFFAFQRCAGADDGGEIVIEVDHFRQGEKVGRGAHVGGRAAIEKHGGIIGAGNIPGRF